MQTDKTPILATHRLVELSLTTHKLTELQLATRLDSNFTGTQLAESILESLTYQSST